MQVRSTKSRNGENPASFRTIRRWKPSLLGITRRIVAVINLFMGAALVEYYYSKCLGAGCAAEAPINTPIAFYAMVGAGLVVIAASLVALFVKQAPFAWAVIVLAILLLILAPSVSAYKERWWPLSEYRRVDFIDVFTPIVWLLLNLLQTWGLNARVRKSRR